jgi:uncharacterized protein CbrC (UPF0167 family)
MDADQPLFRFNPNAYADGISFKRSQDVCELCRRPSVWEYTGNIYTTSPRSTVCARCIAEDRLLGFLQDDLATLHDVDISGAEISLAKEVITRTPGVPCLNPFEWPVINGIPLAFMGYGDNAALINLPGVEEAIREGFAEYRQDSSLVSYVLIFKQLDGDRYRVVVDLD